MNLSTFRCYDPVDMVLGYGDAETISANVQNAVLLLAAGTPQEISEIGDETHARSRNFFNRLDGGAENPATTNLTTRWLFATHSAIGGAPWAGDTPLGHTKLNDIAKATEAHRIIREAARAVGVPIPMKGGSQYGH